MRIRKEEVQEGFGYQYVDSVDCSVDTPLDDCGSYGVCSNFAKKFWRNRNEYFQRGACNSCILFFAYPQSMSAIKFGFAKDTFGLGGGAVVDGFSGATPLGQVSHPQKLTPRLWICSDSLTRYLIRLSV